MDYSILEKVKPITQTQVYVVDFVNKRVVAQALINHLATDQEIKKKILFLENALAQVVKTFNQPRKMENLDQVG